MITEILLKVALNTINQTKPNQNFLFWGIYEYKAKFLYTILFPNFHNTLIFAIIIFFVNHLKSLNSLIT